MPLPFDQFQGKGVLGFLDSSPRHKIWSNREKIHGRGEDLCYVVAVNNGGFPEPTSVLDSMRSPSPFVSSSTTTLYSSHGGPSGGAAAAAFSDADGKCDLLGFEDFDGVLSGSPGQEQSILRLITAGDVVDPGSGFVGFDPGSGSDPVIDNPNPLFGYGFPFHEPATVEEKFQITTNSEIPVNPNPGFFSFGSDPPSSPPAKRLNSGQPDSHHHHPWVLPFSVPVHESHDPFLTSPKIAGNDEDQSTVIIDQLFNAATKLIGTSNGGDNNPVLAQGILARLNHNLNKNNTNNPKPPFHRAASYIIEALHSLLQDSPPSLSPPQTLILRIAAYRDFSETSPFLQFVNFTANQTILESSEGFDRIHIVDFDIGYGGQWASLIQELAGRRNGSSAPSLKITAFASPLAVSDEFELRFTEENLRYFAGEIGVSFEIELLNMEVLLNPTYWPLLRSSDKEAIAVNLPISSVVSGYLPLILRFLKQISPNVVVCSDRSCDRNNDAPFPIGVIHALQYYTFLLESLDAGNPNQEAATSIERFYVQPSTQKLLTNRYRWMERPPPWRSLFGQCGFSPVTLSQTAETQVEYLLQRNPMRGFHLEKRQSSSSLVLCWQRKELVAVSAWKC